MAKATGVAAGGTPTSRGDDGLLTEGTGDDTAMAVDDLAGLAGPISIVGACEASKFLKEKAEGTN